MNTYTIEFTSLTCGPCASQGEWLIWDTLPISENVDAKLHNLRVRYPTYAWRAV